VPIVGNSPNFIAMNIFFNQFLSIFNGSFLSRSDSPRWSPSGAFPNSNVHIFGAYINKTLPDKT
jgi:hypothetical protein